MKKTLLALALLSTLTTVHADDIQFMRPAISNNVVGKYSHAQLFNPADSGVRVIIDEIQVIGGMFTLVGYGGGVFQDSNFSESRGLSIHQVPDPLATGINYSKAHSRIFAGPAIDGGMWG